MHGQSPRLKTDHTIDRNSTLFLRPLDGCRRDRSEIPVDGKNGVGARSEIASSLVEYGLETLNY
jgi:hypothetical protein